MRVRVSHNVSSFFFAGAFCCLSSRLWPWPLVCPFSLLRVAHSLVFAELFDLARPRTVLRTSKMSFNRFVQAGRVCLINYGPLEGKLCVIVDIIDNNKVSFRSSVACHSPLCGRYLMLSFTLQVLTRFCLRAVCCFLCLVCGLFVRVRACMCACLAFHVLVLGFSSVRSSFSQCLIDGTETNEQCTLERQKINYRRLSLTDFRIEIPRNATFAEMKAAFEKDDIAGKWAATSWAKKRAAKAKRANLSDFDRFKVMVLRKKKAALVKAN